MSLLKELTFQDHLHTLESQHPNLRALLNTRHQALHRRQTSDATRPPTRAILAQRRTEDLAHKLELRTPGLLELLNEREVQLLSRAQVVDQRCGKAEAIRAMSEEDLVGWPAQELDSRLRTFTGAVDEEVGRIRDLEGEELVKWPWAEVERRMAWKKNTDVVAVRELERTRRLQGEDLLRWPQDDLHRQDAERELLETQQREVVQRYSPAMHGGGLAACSFRGASGCSLTV